MNLPYPKYFSAAAFVVLLSAAGILFSGTFSGLSDAYNPHVDDCSVNEEGDITSCQVSEPNLRDTYNRGWERGDTLKLVIADIEPTGDSHSPQSYYLYQNNLISENIGEEDRNDFSNLHLNHGDLQWNSEIQSSLKQGSTCSMDMEIGSPGGFTFTYEKNGEEQRAYYNDEPDSDEEPADDLMNSVTVETSDVEFSNEMMACKFKVEDVLDNNEHDGKFLSWSGRYPTFEGGNDGGSLSNVNVDFNAAPQITGIDAPSTVNTSEEFTASVEVQDVTGDAQISWNNQGTGTSSVYSFSEPGEKNISATVTLDGNQDTGSQTVEVNEPDTVTDPVTDPDTGGEDDESGTGFLQGIWKTVTGFFGGLI